MNPNHDPMNPLKQVTKNLMDNLEWMNLKC